MTGPRVKLIRDQVISMAHRRRAREGLLIPVRIGISIDARCMLSNSDRLPKVSA